MRKIWAALGIVVLGAIPAWSVTFHVSTFIPTPGEKIVLWAAGVPLGAEFAWDLNGDGIADRTTDSPRLEWTVPQGAHRIGLVVTHEGKEIASFAALIVADPDFAAYQQATYDGQVYEVTVTLVARSSVSAPGLNIEVPEGWGVEIGDEGGFVHKLKGGIQGFWPQRLSPGDELTLRYRLIPLTEGARYGFSGTASAVVVGKGYREVPIAGMLSYPSGP